MTSWDVVDYLLKVVRAAQEQSQNSMRTRKQNSVPDIKERQ